MRRAILAVVLGAVAVVAGCDDKSGGGGATSATAGGSAGSKPKSGPSASTAAATTSAKPATTAAPAAPKMTLADVQKDAGKRWIDAFGSHDAKKFAALYAENAVLHAQNHEVKGRAEIEKNFGETFKVSSDVKLGISRIFWHGKEAASEWVMAGKNDVDTAAAKASGKSFGFKGVSIVTYNDDGLVTEEWMAFDTLTFIAQLGLAAQSGLPATLPAAPPPVVPTGAPEVHMAKDGDPAAAKDIDVVDKLVAAENANKWDDALALWADDGTEWMNVLGGTETKKKDIKAHEADWMKTFPDGKVELKLKFATDGDFVITAGGWKGTFKGPFKMPGQKDLPPNGKVVSLSGIHVFQLKAGKVEHEWAYHEGLELAMQTGMMGAPAAAPAASGAAHPAPTTTAAPH